MSFFQEKPIHGSGVGAQGDSQAAEHTSRGILGRQELYRTRKGKTETGPDWLGSQGCFY